MTDLPNIPAQPGNSSINPDTDFNTPGSGSFIDNPSGSSISKGSNVSQADVEAFQDTMDAQQANLEEATQKIQQQANNVMELSAQNAGSTQNLPNIETSASRINHHFEGLKGSIDFLGQHPQASLPSSDESMIRNRVKGFLDNYDSVKSTIGQAPLENRPGLGDSFKDMLSYFTNVQDGMKNLTNDLGEAGKDMGPADLIKVQHKLHKMQEQIEFVTSAVNKGVEWIKQTMNIQL